MAKKPSDQPRKDDIMSPAKIAEEKRKESIGRFSEEEQKVLQYVYEHSSKGVAYTDVKKLFIPVGEGYAIDESEILTDGILNTLIRKELVKFCYVFDMPAGWDKVSIIVGDRIWCPGVTTSPRILRVYQMTDEGLKLVLSWREPLEVTGTEY